MTMITPSYLGETIEYSSLHACRSTLEDPTRLVLLAAPGQLLVDLLETDNVRGKHPDGVCYPPGRSHVVHPQASARVICYNSHYISHTN